MTSNLSALIRAAALAGVIIVATTTLEAQTPGPDNPRREMLEQRLRERTGDIVRRRLGLSDDQMRQLQSTNRQFEQRRSALIMRERELRRELRTQVVSETPDQNRVSQLLDQTMQLERQRLDLVQNEQRELAKFLTPVQRARLLAIQMELRRRTQEMRNRGMQRRGGRPMRPGIDR